jgi:hypothetical protein
MQTKLVDGSWSPLLMQINCELQLETILRQISNFKQKQFCESTDFLPT